MINEEVIKQAVQNLHKYLKKVKRELSIIEAELDDSAHKRLDSHPSKHNKGEEISPGQAEKFIRHLAAKFKIKKEKE
jgi:hypothetical protein